MENRPTKEPLHQNYLNETELLIVARQTGVFVIRYYVAEHIAERFFDSMALFGVPKVTENFPECMLDTGFISNETIDDYQSLFDNIQAGIASGSASVQLRQKNGEFCWYQVAYSLVAGEDGDPVTAIITFFDNTEAREMEIAYKKWRASLSTLLDKSMLFAEVNLTNDSVEYLEGLALQQLGNHTTLSGLVEYDSYRFVLPEFQDAFQEFFGRGRLLHLFYSGITEDSLEYRMRIDGKDYWARADVHMMKYPHSDEVMMIITFMDIDKQRREIAKLSHMASHDPLTGVLNRQAMEQRITQALKNLPQGQTCALFIIDLDNFKQVNDQIGHQSGDALIQKSAAVISSIFRTPDLVGRLGGDEFIVFLTGNITPTLAAQRASALVNALQFNFDQQKLLPITASVGVALSSGQAKFDWLYHVADTALYTAKDAGKNEYHLINADTSEELHEAHFPTSLDPIHLQAMLEYMAGSLLIVEVGKKIEASYISPSYYKRMGLAPEPARETGKKLFSYIFEEDAPGLRNAFKEVAQTGVATHYAYRTQLPGRPDVYWHDMRIARMPGKNDGARMLVCAIHDITDLKYACDRFRIVTDLILEKANTLVWFLDLSKNELRIQSSGPNFRQYQSKVFHTVPDSILTEALLPADSFDAVRQMYQDIINGVEGKDYSFRIRDAQGSLLPCSASFSFLRGKDKSPLHAVGILTMPSSAVLSQAE